VSTRSDLANCDTRFDCWSEVADNYADVVAVLNSDWRVIVCRDLMSWSLQRRRSPERPSARMPRSYIVPSVDWQGRGYFSVAADLRRAVREVCGAVDTKAAAVLFTLPDRIGGRTHKAAPPSSVEELRDAEPCPLERLHALLSAKL
jgi:hypothetical protein